MKSMKQCGRAAQAAGAGIGAVVSLKVDYHTHSHAQGLLVIVYEMKESTGGILVCCEHGVITHDGSRKDYWVPYDKYTVNAERRIHTQLRTLFSQYATWFWRVGTSRQINEEFHIQSIMR